MINIWMTLNSNLQEVSFSDLMQMLKITGDNSDHLNTTNQGLGLFNCYLSVKKGRNHQNFHHQQKLEYN